MWGNNQWVIMDQAPPQVLGDLWCSAVMGDGSLRQALCFYLPLVSFCLKGALSSLLIWNCGTFLPFLLPRWQCSKQCKCPAFPNCLQTEIPSTMLCFFLSVPQSVLRDTGGRHCSWKGDPRRHMYNNSLHPNTIFIGVRDTAFSEPLPLQLPALRAGHLPSALSVMTVSPFPTAPLCFPVSHFLASTIFPCHSSPWLLRKGHSSYTLSHSCLLFNNVLTKIHPQSRDLSHKTTPCRCGQMFLLSPARRTWSPLTSTPEWWLQAGDWGRGRWC